MAAVLGVAGATGRVARRESHAPARPLLTDAVASPATAPWGLGGAPSAGGPKDEKGRAGALHDNQE
eukprot:scaffold12441_cov29-Tisochrysis_lutea.AAC.1